MDDFTAYLLDNISSNKKETESAEQQVKVDPVPQCDGAKEHQVDVSLRISPKSEAESTVQETVSGSEDLTKEEQQGDTNFKNLAQESITQSNQTGQSNEEEAPQAESEGSKPQRQSRGILDKVFLGIGLVFILGAIVSVSYTVCLVMGVI